MQPQVLCEPLPFRIPIYNYRALSSKSRVRDLCCSGDSEYGDYVTSFLQYKLAGESEAGIVTMCGLWLVAILSCSSQHIIYRNQQNDSSCRQNRPHAVVYIRNVLAFKVETKYADKELVSAEIELTDELAPKAHLTFPKTFCRHYREF